MKLFIPACGDRIVLAQDWTFPLYLERRNMQFAKKLGLVAKDVDSWGVYEGERYRSGYKRVNVTLSAGTIIECDRVYIRTFNKSRLELGNDYDSITWKTIKKGKAETHGRFWTKLCDCNGLEYELQHDSLYRDRVKLVKQVMEA